MVRFVLYSTLFVWCLLYQSRSGNGDVSHAQQQAKQVEGEQDVKLVENMAAGQLIKTRENENVSSILESHTINAARSDRAEAEGETEKMPKSSADNIIIITKDKLNQDIYTKKNLNASEQYFYHLEELHNEKTIAEAGHIALKAKLQCSVYSDMYTHRYDSFNELKVSGGPQVDQELCLKQLKNLYDRSEMQSREKFASKDINLYQLLDTFGRVPPGMLTGHASWMGMYTECSRMMLIMPEGLSKTRYCWAHIRHPSWPKNEPLSEVAMLKTGVCLPKSCDSMNYKNKYELLLGILSYNMRRIDVDQGEIANLYCLPDEESSLTIWWQNPKTTLSVLAIASWCLFLVFCTIKSNQLNENTSTLNDELKVSDEATNSTEKRLSSTSSVDEKEKQQVKQTTSIAIYRSLSITNNLRLLFNTTKKSALLETGNKLKRQFSEQDTEQVSKLDKIVDLSCLEGIKVICMGYVIMGHVLMCLTTSIVNGRETAAITSPTFFIANLVPAFAVNSFFTITAFLTSYLMFKQNTSYSFLTSPLKWIAFILYRYLRIMPMYLIVVLYTKHIARYTGSGPIWDYGTSSLGQRRACEQESWLWTLLFGANLKSPLDHCIPSAWYLANDFQFFMITPIFLGLLHKSPDLGRKVIKGGIFAGSIAGFLSVFLSDVDDLTPIARFMPHGFKTYVTHLYANYTQPQYRIPAYLCGLLIGFALYQFEQDKLKYLASKRNRERNEDQQDHSDKTEPLLEPDWSDKFKARGSSYSLFFVFICVITPVIGSGIPFNKLGARAMVSIIMPAYHVFFSLAVGLYILLATTGYGNKKLNKFLAAPFWKPLARLSLCAVLINVEVINYIIQSNNNFNYLDNQYQLSLNMLSIIGTYLASIVMCVLFEAPVRAALNHLLSYAITKMSAKQKVA